MMKVRVTSEPYVGRFVGPILSGLRTNPTLVANPEVVLPGSPYALYVQEEAATLFFEPKAIAVQAELQNLGLNSVLVP
jgi:hypothetical protein